MDFTNRSAQPQSFQPASPAPSSAPQPSHNKKDKKDDSRMSGIFRWSTIAMVLIGALLLAALAALLVVAKPDNQGKYVNSSKLQAVFLNTGQVYFGKISKVTNDYFVLGNIYYLQSSATGTDQKSTDGNISLVKLGCELHRPYDSMIINRSEITFWENLKSDGQVANAVDKFEKANPSGQKCSDTAAAAPTNTNVQGNTTNTNSTSDTSNTTKKP
jgi:hypothetical protein